MNESKAIRYGAVIERGIVAGIETEGYVIRSVDREGVVTPPLRALNGTYAVRDRVFFFMFNDGDGAVIGRGR